MNLTSKRYQITGSLWVIFAFLMISSCVATKEAAVPSAWESAVDWGSYNSAEVTPSDNIILQNDTDIIVRNGENGHVILKEIEHKGMFAQFASDIKEQTLGPLSKKNNVHIKYWHRSLPASHTLLLFDRSTDDGTIRSIDSRTGDQLWTSKDLAWNLEKFKDEANYVVDLAAKVSFGSAVGSGIASSILLQNRAIKSMVKEIPQKNAFLFKTVDGALSMIDSRSGRIIWQSRDVSSTGLASVKYLADSDELLIAGDMGGLKDIIKSSDAEETMKQVYRIDANDGNVIWSTKYKGRESQIDDIVKKDKEVLLYFTGGSLEFFDYSDGTRQFGTRDNMKMGTARFASAISSENTMETSLTSMPIIEGNTVYAINPTGKVHAASLDNKQLVKYNYQTGKVIWKSPVLEKAVDVRNMKSTDKLIIISIPGAGNMLGGAKHAGIYAFDKKTGKQAWQFTEPISKKYYSNILYRSSDLLTGDGNTIYRLNAADGKLIAKKAFKDPDIGSINHIRVMPGDTSLCALGSKGVSIINSDDLTPVYSTTVSGHISSDYVNDNIYVGASSKLLSTKGTFFAFGFPELNKIANFTLQKPDAKLFGNLDEEGYLPINDMRQVVVMNSTGLTAYNLY